MAEVCPSWLVTCGKSKLLPVCKKGVERCSKIFIATGLLQRSDFFCSKEQVSVFLCDPPVGFNVIGILELTSTLYVPGTIC